MSKKIFGFALGALLLALSFPTDAQQPKKVSRIGYLAASSPSAQLPRTEAPSGKVCASLATSRGKTLSLSCALERESPNVSPRSRPS
jgi:hypothetical protein